MFSGRQLTIKRDSTVVAGVRTKSMTINNTPIDITTDDDSGFRTLLELPGEKQIDASVEGLLKDETLIADAATGTSLIENATITLPSGGVITGSFRLNSMEIGGEYLDSVTFTAELQSSGAFVYTP